MRVAAVLGLLLAAIPQAAAGERDILFWAPYGPGSPEQAAAALEEFARYVEKASGWPPGSASAVYRNTEEGGLEALDAIRPGFAVVPLPLHLRYHGSLDWRPIRSVVLEGAEAQRYTLYGSAGSSLESLPGITLEGDSVYDPVFVNHVVLAGAVRVAEASLRPTARPLSAIRRVLRGEKVAVLLDEPQRRALDALPAAGDLVLLAESPWMPAALVVQTGAAGDDAAAQHLGRALDGFGSDPDAAALLETLQIRRFEPVAGEEIERLAAAYRGDTTRQQEEPVDARPPAAGEGGPE